MAYYIVSFFKKLLSSDGHPFKVVQRVLEVCDCQNADEAISVAQRRFAIDLGAQIIQQPA